MGGSFVSLYTVNGYQFSCQGNISAPDMTITAQRKLSEILSFMGLTEFV
jgi:hypothetical protein